MTVPYTYLIGWTKYDRWYYGVKYGQGCNPSDFWVKYFTSSSRVHGFRAQYGEPDIIEIRRIFISESIDIAQNKAKAWEQKVLRRLNVSSSERWLNVCVSFPPPSGTGDSNPFFGKHHSSETKATISRANSGKVRTQQHRDIISATHKGKHKTLEHRQKISAATAEREWKQESKDKLSRRFAKSWEITFPDGHKESITNLNLFCKEHGLIYTNMYKTMTNNKKCKGFTCRSLNSAKIKRKPWTQEQKDAMKLLLAEKRVKKEIP